MKRIAIIAAVIAPIAGCAMTWGKDGATLTDFKVDNYACERDARQSGYYGGGLAGALNMRAFYRECMESKGYALRQ